MSALDLSLLGLLWLAYFAFHSLFASLWLKRHLAARWPRLMPWYRLIFNVLAVLLLLPPAAMAWWLGGDPLWRFERLWKVHFFIDRKVYDESNAVLDLKFLQ